MLPVLLQVQRRKPDAAVVVLKRLLLKLLPKKPLWLRKLLPRPNLKRRSRPLKLIRLRSNSEQTLQCRIRHNVLEKGDKGIMALSFFFEFIIYAFINNYHYGINCKHPWT